MGRIRASMAEEDIIGPMDITYCGACGFPAEYCEFRPKKQFKNECTPWLLENMDRPFLEKYGLVQPEGEEVPDMDISLEDAPEKDKEQAKSKKGEKLGKGDKLMPGGKVKKMEPKCVTAERLTRNKRKFTTVVTGLEHFGLDLKSSAKIFGKKFSCGAAPVKGEAGKPDAIVIQGDFLDEVLDVIAESKEFDAVPEDALFIKDGSKKKPY